MLWKLSSATCRAFCREHGFVLGTEEKEIKYTRRDLGWMSGERREPRMDKGKEHEFWSPVGLGSRPSGICHMASPRDIISLVNWG